MPEASDERCPSCGDPVYPTDSVCMSCGARLTVRSRAASADTKHSESPHERTSRATVWLIALVVLVVALAVSGTMYRDWRRAREEDRLASEAMAEADALARNGQYDAAIEKYGEAQEHGAEEASDRIKWCVAQVKHQQVAAMQRAEQQREAERNAAEARRRAAQATRETTQRPRDQEYINKARDWINVYLKAPSTARFSNERVVRGNDGNCRVMGNVDSQNGFGAMLRSSYTVTFPSGDGDVPTPTTVYVGGSIFKPAAELARMRGTN